jgi:membrane associated rhomboid family serine protease
MVGNFSFILLIGPILEEKYGSKMLLSLIFFTALVTGILNAVFFNNALLGASGIVFMMILLVSFANVQKGKIPLTFILVALLYLGQEVYQAVSSADNISQFAHIIGGICGGIFGYVISGNSGKTSTGGKPTGLDNLTNF